MKRTKAQKGITLVALIITIIVLLILAVVAIRAVQGDGIIVHAKDAKEKAIEAQDKEKIMLALNEWKIVKNTNAGTTFENFMKEKFGADKVQAGSTAEEVIVTLENGNQYKVKTDGTIETIEKGISISKSTLTLILDKAETKTAELTATPNGIEGEITWSNSDNTKATISSTSGEKITVTGVAEGSTTITVSCGSYSKTCSVTVLAKIDHSEIVVPTIAKTGVYAESSNIKEVREGNIPIPNGFTYVKGDHIGGAVITDGTSEFVWVPVTTMIAPKGLNTGGLREPDVVTGVTPSSTVNSASGTQYDAVPANLKRAGFDTSDLNNDLVKSDGTEGKDGEVNAYDFKQQLTNEFSSMAESVNKYHGFYVGRYEMSLNASGKAQSKANETSMYNSETSKDWYAMYAKAKTYTNSSNSVKSSMIWGSQYDAMMSWMKGNEINVDISDTPTDLSIGKTVRNQDKDNRITGSQPKDKLSNVFDLLGNSFEWSLESRYDDCRAYRGGTYLASKLPKYRYVCEPTATYNDYGSRLALYIQ